MEDLDTKSIGRVQAVSEINFMCCDGDILLSKIIQHDTYDSAQGASAVFLSRSKGTKWNTMPRMVLERLKEVLPLSIPPHPSFLCTLLLALHNTPTDELWI